MATAAPIAETSRPHEVADILRDHAQDLRLTPQQARAVRDIRACRTERLGGHLEECPLCGFSRGTYNSCRNRHCPKCQRLRQALWAEAQEALLLPTVYFQIVFTIPSELHPLFRRTPELCLKLLFEAVSETLTEVARTKLRAQIGFTAVLHTWSQKLLFHPHIHCIVPAGGLSFDGLRWTPTSMRFFLPVKALRKLFRGKLLAKLEQAIRAGEIAGDLADNLHILRSTPKTWNVDAKRPLAGPDHVVRYLSRYVHRIAISNSRITEYDGQNVSFRYKDRKLGVTRELTVPGRTFARLFLQHVLPARFVRIRHYGLLAARCRPLLARCRALLGASPALRPEKDPNWIASFERLFGSNPCACPACKVGVLVKTRVLPRMRR